MKGANYTDMEGGQLNGNRRWPTIRIWKEGGQLYGYGRWPTIRMEWNGGQQLWPTIRIWKVANNMWPTMRIMNVGNYTDNEGAHLYG